MTPIVALICSSLVDVLWWSNVYLALRENWLIYKSTYCSCFNGLPLFLSIRFFSFYSCSLNLWTSSSLLQSSHPHRRSCTLSNQGKLCHIALRTYEFRMSSWLLWYPTWNMMRDSFTRLEVWIKFVVIYKYKFRYTTLTGKEVLWICFF